jgi:L-lactate utilization protein LutC
MKGVMPTPLPGELLQKFEGEFQALSGSTYRAARRDGLDQILRQILANGQATRVVLSRNPVLQNLGLREWTAGWGLRADFWPRDSSKAAEDAYREACFAADVGITGVDFALAESGTLVLTSSTEGSQLSSLAPPVHIALYRPSQLRGSLDEVLEALPVKPASGGPSTGRSVVFVTGPSRTADIEQILIRGVHGPREVHAILVEDACFESLKPAR